jgi:error-prone DNA polymerase
VPEHPHPKLYTGPQAEPPTHVAPGQPAFAELDVTTNFSFLRGASHPDELVYESATLGYRAMGVTDVNTVAGVVRAYEAARKIAGFKLVVGARLVFHDGTPDVLVWPTDKPAYSRLSQLLTLGRRRAPKGECHLTIDDLPDHQTGMQAAVCPPSVGFGTVPVDFEKAIVRLRDVVGDRLSLMVGLGYGDDDTGRLLSARHFSRRFGVPLLATNHVHYHDPGRRPLQDVLTCVRHKCTVHDAGFKLFANAERYLKSPGQMRRLFRDCPEAIDRAVFVAGQCRFDLGELRYDYPTEAVPAGANAGQHLRKLTYEGAADRYPGGVPPGVVQLLEKELAFICGSKYESYFLTVHDLVRYARSRGILCQGRGSAANSAVCYCLGVTAVDPDKFTLTFERFASSARAEPPDIDIDFEHERREEVIQYVYEKYGRDRAAMTASLITYRGRSAVRDVGKALGFSLDAVDTLAGKLDWWHNGTLSETQIREAGIDPADAAIIGLINLSTELLGFPRHLSQHVGGMVISRSVLSDLVPIENAAMANRTVIEWDKDDLDTLGFFKVDILALGMLTCISKALVLIGSYGPKLELHTIPAEDKQTYEMICDADTVGVFQIESRAQMAMLPRLRPVRFYDLVIEVAIVRPGPIQGDMVHPYLERRERQRRDPNFKVQFPKPRADVAILRESNPPVSRDPEGTPEGERVRWSNALPFGSTLRDAANRGVDDDDGPLADVLAKTLGVPLFQEQAMRMAVVAAGFTPEESDLLRKAMAAWKRGSGIEKFHDKFIGGMLANGYEPEFAERCFKQISGFGEYGFPESHAASFAILVYASCWIKRHHPAAFAAALLNSQPMGFYAPAQIVRDARAHGVTVLPVDVNFSGWDCALEWESPSIVARVSNPWADAPADRRYSVDDSPSGTSSGGVEMPTPGEIFAVPVDAALLLKSAEYGRLAGLPAHGLETRATKETWGTNGPAIRLGFRQIKGMRQADADRIVACRNSGGPFVSPAQLQRRTGLERAALNRLAGADAMRSMTLNRRDATWMTLGAVDGDTPLLDEVEDANPVVPPPLPVMAESVEVMADYNTTGLSLKRHPVWFARAELGKFKVVTAAALTDQRKFPHGKWVGVAGLVLVRQRPGTASGVVFITLEDETGVANLVVWSDVYERNRPVARHAVLLHAEGFVQRSEQVVHIVTHRMYDRTPLLHGLTMPSRDFH